MGKLGYIVSATKMFLNLLGNIFASWKANFVSATIISGVGKLANIDRKYNVSATVFPSLPRGLIIHANFTSRDHGVCVTHFCTGILSGKGARTYNFIIF